MENSKNSFESKTSLMIDIRRFVEKINNANECNLADCRFILENSAEKETRNIVKEMQNKQEETRYDVSILQGMIEIIGKML